MTIEEENDMLRDLIEKHVFSQMNLCSQTLRDLRKIRAMESSAVIIPGPSVEASSSKVYW